MPGLVGVDQATTRLQRGVDALQRLPDQIVVDEQFVQSGYHHDIRPGLQLRQRSRIEGVSLGKPHIRHVARGGGLAALLQAVFIAVPAQSAHRSIG